MADWEEMTVDGETFTPEEQAEAWANFKAEEGYRHLAGWLGKVHHTPGSSDKLLKAARKMLRNAKEAGIVTYERRKWHKVA